MSFSVLGLCLNDNTDTIDGDVYTLDAAGNRTAKTDDLAGVTSNYTYDQIYELTQVTQGATTTESYGYDPVGNRLSSLTVPSYTVNSSNEMTANSNASYTYDNNGNTTSKTNSSGTTNYAWDFENRLKQVTLPGTGGTVAFLYDPFGRRIQKAFTQNGTTTTTNYAYDGDNVIETTNQSGSIVSRFSQDQSIDEPLAESASGATDYYEADGLGSITSLTSATGSIAQSYTYDSFGNTTHSTGSLANLFQYTARDFDSETGLYYYRARYYDVNAGRFLSEDPLGFSFGNNFYTYVLNNPGNDIDPSGLSAYGVYKTLRRLGPKANCFADFASCQLQADVNSLNSMSVEAITNTTIAQQRQGPATGDGEFQRVQLCLSADHNCKEALERCIKLALSNPFPPPWWLTDVINYFSKHPQTPSPPVKRQ